MEQDLAIIILNYNSHVDVVRQLLEFIDAGAAKKMFYVLDNNSSDGFEVEIFCKKNDVFFHQMTTNFGFAHANNWAIKAAINDGKTYFLLLNPDIHISLNDAHNLFKALTDNNMLGVIGPRLLDESDQTKIFSDGGLLFKEKGFKASHVNGGNSISMTNDSGLLTAISYVNGSSMMFKKSVIDEIGYMDEHLFMYFEESEWCYRVKTQTHWLLATALDVKALQKDSSRGPQHEYYMTRNRLWFCRKHKGNIQSFVAERFRKITKFWMAKNVNIGLKISYTHKILKGMIDGSFIKI